MSPYELDILIHYYGHVEDHPDFLKTNDLAVETRGRLFYEQLVEENLDGNSKWRLASRGRVFVEAITKMPLPMWRMPNE